MGDAATSVDDEISKALASGSSVKAKDSLAELKAKMGMSQESS